MRRWCFVPIGLLVGALLILPLRGEDRMGASIFAQADAPPASLVSVGSLWFETDTNTLRVVTVVDPLTWSQLTNQTGGAGVPAGLSAISFSAACPSGWTEVAGANGKTLYGTLTANADAGGTLGADSITPAGTNSGAAVSAHAGTTVADHASHTHTYTDVIAHTHVVTSQTATTGSATSYEHGTLDTSSAEAEATEVTGSTGIATGTTAGPGAVLTHSVTQPSAHAVTQPTFAGTAFDNRSAGVKVIFCEKS